MVSIISIACLQLLLKTLRQNKHFSALLLHTFSNALNKVCIESCRWPVDRRCKFFSLSIRCKNLVFIFDVYTYRQFIFISYYLQLI